MANIQIAIDGHRARQGAREVNRALGSIKRESRSLNTAMRRDVNELGGFFRSLKGAAAGFAASFAAITAANVLREITNVAVEMDALNRSFKAAAGSAQAGAAAFGFVRQEAERLGLQTVTTATGYKQLLAAVTGSGKSATEAQIVFQGLAEASTALGLSANDTNGILLAASQTFSKGKVAAEELRGQIGERLPGAFSLMAKALGVSTQELDNLLQQGRVTSDALVLLGRELHNRFGKDAMDAATGARAEFNRLDNAITDLKNTFGQELLPAIVPVVRELTSLVRSIADVKDEIKGTIAAINDFTKPVQPLAQKVGGSFLDAITTANPQFALGPAVLRLLQRQRQSAPDTAFAAPGLGPADVAGTNIPLPKGLTPIVAGKAKKTRRERDPVADILEETRANAELAAGIQRVTEATNGNADAVEGFTRLQRIKADLQHADRVLTADQESELRKLINSTLDAQSATRAFLDEQQKLNDQKQLATQTIDDLKAQRDLLQQISALGNLPTDQRNNEIARLTLLNDLKQRGIDLNSTEGATIRSLVDDVSGLQKGIQDTQKAQEESARQWQDFENAAQGALNSVASAIDNFVQTGKLNIAQLGLELIKLASQANGIFGSKGSSGSSGFGSIFSGIGSLFGLGSSSGASSAGLISSGFGIDLLADGGLVTGPTPAIVGERGPELVVPLKNGKVPIEGGGGGNTYNVTLNINNPADAQSFRRSEKQLARRFHAALDYEARRGGRR